MALACMPRPRPVRVLQLLSSALVLALLFQPSRASAQTNTGFSIARFTPTAAGEWSFGVDHPWYTKSRYFAAAGITLDYAHDPLLYGVRSGSSFSERDAI